MNSMAQKLLPDLGSNATAAREERAEEPRVGDVQADRVERVVHPQQLHRAAVRRAGNGHPPRRGVHPGQQPGPFDLEGQDGSGQLEAGDWKLSAVSYQLVTVFAAAADSSPT